MNILKRDSVSLPLLQRALWNFFYRHPDFSSGLSRFDTIILHSVKKHAPNAARCLGYTLGHDMHVECKNNIHELDCVGDIYLFARLKNMARPNLKRPLLSLNTMKANLRETTVEITELGLDVLNGKGNAIDVNGINDEIAGVVLRPNRPIWFRKENELIEAKG